MARTFEECVRDACLHTGLMKPDAAAWIAAIVEPLWAAGSTQREMNAAVLQDPRCAGALTAAGLADAERAVDRVVHGGWVRRSRDLRLDAFGECPDWPVRISVVDDPRTCGAARRWHGQLRLPKDLPRIPLAECDAEICRCSYSQVPLAMARRRYGWKG